MIFIWTLKEDFSWKKFIDSKGVAVQRTDAQKACRIDVNKASRLFAAFEKVGWLQDKHFEKYL